MRRMCWHLLILLLLHSQSFIQVEINVEHKKTWMLGTCWQMRFLVEAPQSINHHNSFIIIHTIMYHHIITMIIILGVDQDLVRDAHVVTATALTIQRQRKGGKGLEDITRAMIRMMICAIKIRLSILISLD